MEETAFRKAINQAAAQTKGYGLAAKNTPAAPIVIEGVIQYTNMRND